MKAKAPIVPVAVVGAEEAMPIFAHLPLQAAHRPDLRRRFPARPAASLPAGQVLHPLPRADPDRPSGDEPWEDAGLVQTVAEDVRARIQEELYEMLAGGAPSGSGEARPHHRPLQLLGRPARAGAREGRRRSRRSSASRPTTRRSRSSAPSSSASAPSTRCCGGSSTRPRSTPSSTRGWSSTRARAAAREAHEQNVIGTMNVLAACGGPDSPVRKVVFKSSAHYYGCERDDPCVLHRGDAAPAPAAHAAGVGHRRGRRRGPGLRGAQPRRHGHHAALLQRPRAGPADQPHRAARAARRPRHPRLRPALPVHPRGRHRRLRSSTRW